jgi:imidazolonepropionase-like amidohydrolase
MGQPSAAVLAVLAVASMIGQAPPAGPAPVRFRHVSVVDVRAGTVRPDQDVTIRDGRIASVRPAANRDEPGIRSIDASGKFLIPGLADMHVHWYDERYIGLFVANGVTSVRQMWGGPTHLEWRTRIESGQLLGPRFSVASPIVDGPNPVWPGSIVAADADAASAIVGRMKGAGFDFVKVYSRLPRDAYFAIAKAAKANGIPYAGHVPNAISALEASDAGQLSIEHQTGILLAVSKDEERLRAESVRLFTGGEANQGIDPGRRPSLRALSEALLSTYDPAKASVLFARFARNGTWMSPTLTVLRAMSSLDDPRFTADARTRFMPKQIVDSWNPAKDPRNATKTADDYALDRRVYRRQLEIVAAMNKAGVPIVAGTDVLNPFVFPGFSLHDELGLLVEAGLTPAEALRTATVNAATYLGTGKTSGTIEEGKTADLVLLDANPLDDIANTRRIAAVAARGRLLERAEIDGILAKAEKLSGLKSISEAMLAAITRDGVDAAIRAYRELKARQADVYDFSESELNDAGYALMKQKKLAEAIALLELNVEMYPRSGNVYDSLGEAHAAAGHRELAIANYRKSLAIEPGNQNAIDQLKKLGGG